METSHVKKVVLSLFERKSKTINVLVQVIDSKKINKKRAKSEERRER
jgi:hypothetical protein